MTRIQRIGVLGLCVAMAAGMIVPPMLRAATPAAPTAAPAGAAGNTKAVRSADKIVDDLDVQQELAMKVMPSLKSVADPAFRASDGAKAVPVLKKMVSLLAELEEAAPAEDKETVRLSRYRFMAFTAVLGDKEILATLEEKAKGKDADALSSKAALALVHWLAADGDAVAQGKVLDEFGGVAKENPTSNEVASILMVMTQLGPANNDVTKKVIDVMRTDLQGPTVKAMLADMDGAQEQMALVGKPFTVAGRTSTDGKFSSAEYKGKVVMVDFWATWCGPCIAELPNVKKVYADYHTKGLEIVGVSCDTEDGVLNTFIKEKEMPWMQLRESSQNEAERWHPLAKQWHVDGIPAMFLIDRNGVLRYVDAREDLEKKVAELIKEPVKTETK